MATYVKIPDWMEYVHEGAVNLASDTFQVALSNTAPASETPNPLTSGNGILVNVTQIAYTNLSTQVMTLASSAEAGGVYTLDLNDLVLTASGAVATFRYVYIFDQTAVGDPLIAHFDHGSAVTMANGDTYTITLNASGLYTVT